MRQLCMHIYVCEWVSFFSDFRDSDLRKFQYSYYSNIVHLVVRTIVLYILSFFLKQKL